MGSVFASIFVCLSFFVLGGFWEFSWGSKFFISSVFVFDSVGFYMSLLTLFLYLMSSFFWASLSSRSMVMMGVSVVSSVLCYSCCHALLFWVFYEVSIMSLLYLMVRESPYSERYLASWYFVGYVVVTSLPMMLCLFYLSILSGSFNLLSWGFSSNEDCWVVVVILGVLFLTKIPVPPFHSWLPVVHAESTSFVSVYLSGYMMKLGLLGVYRFCWGMAGSILLKDSYLYICLVCSLFFFFVSMMELDGKRWIAFMSLSHMLVGVVMLSYGDYWSSSMVFYYSFGHGLSAGLVFILLWWCSEVCGSRKWVVLKDVLNGNVVVRYVFMGLLCTVASLPPLSQFFSEVAVLERIGNFSVGGFLLLCLYLFVGKLVPMVLISFCVSRSGINVIFVDKGLSLVLSMVVLVFLSFLLFLMM